MKEEKLTFWNRICISVKDIEKYQIISREKIYRSIIYLLIMIIIISTIISVAIYYKFEGSLLDSAKYIANIVLENEDIESLNEAIENIGDNNNFGFIRIYFSVSIIYLISTFLDSISLSIMGYFVCKITKFKMSFKELYNVSIHCLTLPLILNLVYILINIITGFVVIHFSIMCTIVACIYLIAAILIIREDIIKRNMELMKIIEEQAKVRLELKRQELERKEQEEKEKVKEKDRKKEKQSKDDKESESNETPEGNNA